MRLLYPAIFTQEDDGCYVEFTDLTGCQSTGDTIEETYANGKEALSLYLEVLIDLGKEIPPPTPLSKITQNNSPNSLFMLMDVSLSTT